jgi:hypothetical protein
MAHVRRAVMAEFCPFKMPFKTRRGLEFELEVLDMDDRGMMELGMADVGMADVAVADVDVVIQQALPTVLDKTLDKTIKTSLNLINDKCKTWWMIKLMTLSTTNM